MDSLIQITQNNTRKYHLQCLTLSDCPVWVLTQKQNIWCKMQLLSEGIFIRRKVSYKITLNKRVSCLGHYKAFTTIPSKKTQKPKYKED